jgi:hypothetical protein
MPSGCFAGRPGFTVVETLTLMLGIGPTSAIFSVVQRRPDKAAAVSRARPADPRLRGSADRARVPRVSCRAAGLAGAVARVRAHRGVLARRSAARPRSAGAASRHARDGRLLSYARVCPERRTRHHARRRCKGARDGGDPLARGLGPTLRCGSVHPPDGDPVRTLVRDCRHSASRRAGRRRTLPLLSAGRIGGRLVAVTVAQAKDDVRRVSAKLEAEQFVKHLCARSRVTCDSHQPGSCWRFLPTAALLLAILSIPVVRDVLSVCASLRLWR